MTATYSSPILATLMAYLNAAWRWTCRAMLALVIICMASFIAIATAIVGVSLAVTAVLIRLVGGADKSKIKIYDAAHDDGTITLEARKSPRGWTVE